MLQFIGRPKLTEMERSEIEAAFGFAVIRKLLTFTLNSHQLFYIIKSIQVIRKNEENTMFRLWGKLWKENHLMKDIVISNDSEDTRTHKIFQALDEICYAFDLSKPIWLETNVAEFKKHDKTRFRQDSFIDSIEFDFLEIEVIEE